VAPVQLVEYPTGGSGSSGSGEGAAIDGDQQVWTNPARTLLFAVNQGSDTIAVFKIAGDGTLTAVKGSPFPSGGKAPESVGVSGDTLVVVNKALDFVRKLNAPASVTTFKIHADGTLTPIGQPITSSAQGNPTQAWIDPSGKLAVVPVSSTGQFLTFTRAPDGTFKPGPTTQVTKAQTSFGLAPARPAAGAGGPPSNVLGLLGVVGYPTKQYIYAEAASFGELLVYAYDLTGRLTFIKGLPIKNGLLSCWAEITPDGRFMYVGITANDTIAAYDVSSPTSPRFLQTLKLRGGGGTFNLRVGPSGRQLFALSTRHSSTDNGNLLHVLVIGPDGRLTEPANSPAQLPIAADTSAYGLVVVPRH
jgi:6-phosphogluconolactonase (cycloisomerase 2 family)